MYCIVGLGNPEMEHEGTRHNVGRIVLSTFLKKQHMPSPVVSAKFSSKISPGEVAGEKILVLWPETYMNKSGNAVAKAVKSAKAAQKLVVVYDDIDLPLGTMKLSYGRGSGGHRGVESIIKMLKTKDFIRIRVGISPTTPGGKLKKPAGEQKIIDFLLRDFKKPEREVLQKVSKRVNEALETIITEGIQKAMNAFN